MLVGTRCAAAGAGIRKRADVAARGLAAARVAVRWFTNDPKSRKERGWKEKDAADTGYSPFGNMNKVFSHGLETSSDTESKTQDERAPQGRQERKEFLKAEMEGWQMPKKGDQGKDYEKRGGVTFVNAYGYKDMTAAEREEAAWLAKREKELEQKGTVVLAGVGFLVTIWMLYTTYQGMRSKRTAHPAATCYVGTTVEIKVEVDGKTYEKPLVFGLFTQRAPHACENFVRLITGDNPQGLQLEGTQFFRYEAGNMLYGGVPQGKDSRAGMVAIPGCTTRIPAEDPELAPFEYALVSCAKSFVTNGGFNSVFGILETDNPPNFGYKKCEEAQIVSEARLSGSWRKALTGVKREYLRPELDPAKHGAYIFGVLIDGRDVFKHLCGQLHSKDPYYDPRELVTIKSCKVLQTDLPGRKERMNPEAMKAMDEDGRPDLSKVRAQLAKDKAEAV